MYDTVRYVLLGVIFVGLAGLWFWSRRQAVKNGMVAGTLIAPFKIIQKRWLDQKTGICMVEAEDQTFLLAYTVGGSVSWQPVEKKPEAKPEITSSRLSAPNIFPSSPNQ